MPELLATSIFDDIDTRISDESTDEDTCRLWVDIRAAFEDGGPAAVKAVIEARVRESRLAVERDLKQTRSVTKSTAPKKKASPVKKVAARKRTATK
jgi:hypothetical protein